MPKPIPDNHPILTPYLYIRGAAKAIEYYTRAFGAFELYRMNGPDGTSVMHADLMIGSSRLMLADEFPNYGANSPATLGGSTACVFMYVEDVDKTFARAVELGAKPTMPPTNMFWGDRFSKLEDPFGHHWAIATHIEDVSPEEMARRGAEEMKKSPDCGQA